MTTYIETRVIALNSENASLYKNGDYLSNLIFGFNGLLIDNDDIIERQITLTNAQIPVSFYIVNYTNQIFIIKNIGTGISYNITIPIGNYNSTTFITTVSDAILSTASITMTITIDNITGKLTFNSATNFQFTSTSSLSTANQLFGFSNTSNLVSYLNVTYKATAPYPLNLLGIKQLQVKSSFISANNFSSNSNGQDCLLATIPVNVGAWGMINFDSSTGNNVSFSNRTLDDIDIQIVDAETNKPINFNNCGWTMTLLLHLIRKIDLTKTETNMRVLTKPIDIKMPELKSENKDLADLRILES
mgnify:CR=1 FL=1